jgi:DNA polymerase V
MKTIASGKIIQIKNKHAPEVSKQTGFPSAATHYTEQRISLDNELITNGDATFFVRIAGDAFTRFSIFNNDVLLIDRSVSPKRHNLILLVTEGAFTISKMDLIKDKNGCVVWGVITYIIHDVR